jgi:hypothetical protein
MTEDNIDKLIQMNQRLSLVIGYATSVIIELGKHMPEEKKQGMYWVIEAVENIIYLDKPLPPMP